ncbi:MAG: metal-dependent transcriptional regulator [Clostridiales bacterium]|jgi:Mn-dependent DtxR family transcriptional regulator|nr:metal-dependent transcriptional regulator [Clostridiales bacterium]
MNESGEMYLETIYTLSKQLCVVRAVDIAKEMNFSKPSVTRALNLLQEGGYIEKGKKSDIRLTEIGLKKALSVCERHFTIARFLEIVGVDCNNAQQDACRIEHIICEQTFDCIKEYVLNEDSLKRNKNVVCINFD